MSTPPSTERGEPGAPPAGPPARDGVFDGGHDAGRRTALAITRRGRVVLGIALVALLAVGVGLLLGKAAGYEEVLDALLSASPVWLPVCLGFEVASYAGYVLAFRGAIATDGGPRFRPGLATRTVLASLGASRVISPAGAGGLAVVYWVLRRAGLDRSESAVRVLALNTLIFGVFGAGAWAVAVALLLGLGAEVALVATLPWVVLVPAAVVAAVYVSAPSRAGRLTRPHQDGWLRRGFAAAVAGVVIVRSVLADPGRHAAAIAGAALYWAGDIACLWAALRAVDVHLSLQSVAFAYVTGYVAMLIPLPTGGFGAIDAATTFALTLVGVPLASAFVGVVVWRFFNFWLPTLPAAWELIRLRDLGHDVAAGPGASAPAPAWTSRAGRRCSRRRRGGRR